MIKDRLSSHRFGRPGTNQNANTFGALRRTGGGFGFSSELCVCPLRKTQSAASCSFFAENGQLDFSHLEVLGACAYLKAPKDETVKDEEVMVSSFEELRYSPAARRAHVQGVVAVPVKLHDAGKVVSSAAISGATNLIPDSLSNSKKWRFEPNQENPSVSNNHLPGHWSRVPPDGQAS